MTINNKLDRYPQVYSRIILAVPVDGEPLELTLGSESEATSERLQFYNFLKFVRRNPRLAPHLHEGNKANLISVSLQGSTLRFSMRTKGLTSLENAFKSVAGHLAHIPLPVQEEAPIAAPFSEESSLTSALDDVLNPPAASNLLDILNAHEKESKQ